MKKTDPCVSDLLIHILSDIMNDKLFSPFRLVGGTNLALQFSHRTSTDIDLFTDSEYGSLDFKEFFNWFKNHYPYCEQSDNSSIIGMGRTYYVGNNPDEAVKVDLMYENPFLFPEIEYHGIRMADIREIAVMKLDAIFYGGRKKDFWDLHFLTIDRKMKINDLLDMHQKRFSYQHDREELLTKLQDFSEVDNEPDPICRLGKSWDKIKLDILDLLNP